MIAHLYKITNNVTNQYYIGKRRGNEQGRYWGSGIRIKRHLKKYGKENFTYDVLRVSNEENIFKLERRLITENYINTHKDCLNLAPGGLGGSAMPNRDVSASWYLMRHHFKQQQDPSSSVRPDGQPWSWVP